MILKESTYKAWMTGLSLSKPQLDELEIFFADLTQSLNCLGPHWSLAIAAAGGALDAVIKMKARMNQ